MPEQVRVFVSHHHSDEEDRFTARLVADLEAVGADVWVDTKGITSGNFIRKINEGLAGRQWLVLVMTPAALASEWVQEEVDAALHQVKGKRMLGVIPFVMERCDEALIPPVWAPLHRYDATKGYEGARDGLLRAMGLLPLLRAEAPTSPSPNAQPIILPTDKLPQRLSQLGFAAYRTPRGTEYIAPPLCAVPAGPFLMGSDKRTDPQASDAELPQHSVTLAAYQIAKFPVTVAEYACFVRAGQKPPDNWQQQLGKLDHPVAYVSWQDAMAYAGWLAAHTGQPWRLPSEAEWEKAARGIDGRIYPWGDLWDQSHANTSERGRQATTPVGSYPRGASPYGVLDMSGNVWEWTSSVFKPYPYSVSDGRERAEPPENRVLRGVSWDIYGGNARAAYRNLNLPGILIGVNGFRVVLAAPSAGD